MSRMWPPLARERKPTTMMPMARALVWPQRQRQPVLWLVATVLLMLMVSLVLLLLPQRDRMACR